MSSRYRALYLRYASHHAARLFGVGLPRYWLRRMGHLEEVRRSADGLRLIGWTTAPLVSLAWPGGKIDVTPDIPRADAIGASRGRAARGFDVTLPVKARPLRLLVSTPSGRRAHVDVGHPADPPTPRADARMHRAFLRDMLKAIPALFCYAIRPDDGRKRAIKRAFGLDARAVPRLDACALETSTIPDADPGTYTVIVPIHDAYDVTREALDRLARHSTGDWHAILIDDASCDPRMRPLLREWASVMGYRATLVELARNEGFIRSVNRGLAIARDRLGPVVLLNTDALVPINWAPRLLAPLSDPTVASVTPLSNNAEIFGAPLPCVPFALPQGQADWMDAVASGLGLPKPLADMPTGVGFCMALSRRWLGRIPQLDTGFGRGYGEEVDWCRRVIALGGRHVAQTRLFVEHRGGVSFGPEKAARLKGTNAEICRRYPAYDAEVQACLADDPLRTPRMALAVAAAGAAASEAGAALPMYLGHALGGGAEEALRREVSHDLAELGAALVLRVGTAYRWRLEVHLPQGVLMADTDQIDLIQALLVPVPRLRIVYSCGVGDSDPATLPHILLGLRRLGHRDTVEARLHDYFPLSPSYCLLDASGTFRGPVRTDSTDAAHVARHPDGRAVRLPQWREAWGALFAACDNVTVFSEASGRLLSNAYPETAGRLNLAPHQVMDPPGQVPAPRGRGAIGVLGNLNRQKGAAVVASVARRLLTEGDGRQIVVIGNVDAACPMPRGVTLLGGYARGDIAALATRAGIGTWIVPSVWPETFSFTTREVLATGLPVHAFDIGGQGEAVRAAANGHPVPFDPDTDLGAALVRSMQAASGKALEARAGARSHHIGVNSFASIAQEAVNGLAARAAPAARVTPGSSGNVQSAHLPTPQGLAAPRRPSAARGADPAQAPAATVNEEVKHA